MNPRVILDTGPLVARFSPSDQYHVWAKERFSEIRSPVLTCEAVLMEADHLVRRERQLNPHSIVELAASPAVEIPFRLEDEIERVREILLDYADQRMDLADACLVRMSEQYPESVILTIDTEFSSIYRRHRDQPIPLIIPDDRR